MITGVNVVTVVVPDQEKALRFYTEKLGFRKKTDLRLGANGPRWLSVLPEGANGPELSLFDPRLFMEEKAAEEMLGLVGRMPAIVLGTDDCRRTVEELAGKGVKIERQPEPRPYGVEG